MKPVKGAVIGLVAGLILTAVIVLYMLTTVMAFVLPYLIGFTVVGMMIYGVLREVSVSKGTKQKVKPERKGKYDDFFSN